MIPVSIAYDTIAPCYARHRGARDFVVDVLQRLHRESSGGPVLEVGCGTGAYVTALAEISTCMVYGMDLSRQMLQRAPARDRFAYLQGRVESLPFTDRSLEYLGMTKTDPTRTFGAMSTGHDPQAAHPPHRRTSNSRI